ncbi:hypothetical protein BT93_C1084 [Corymbia citriodora subsp. variegata]|nr:hypothetical protein BT93_C1084 [Corymbia citriodora subsp. variegata]
MAIRNRKLFPALSNTNETINCPDFCDPTCPYNCPDFFFFPPPPAPPPPPPPRPLPLSASDHPGQDSRIPPSLIIIVALLSGFFLLVGLIIAKSSSWWPSRRNPPNPAAAAAADGDDDEDFVDENRIDHPIWFIATVGLQQSIINSITICRYRKGEGLIEGSDCSVCLNEFQEGETLRLLPKCSHAFHIHCIDTWLRSHTNCPLCRASIISGTANLIPSGPTLEMIGLNEDARIENSAQNVELGGSHDRYGAPETRTETEDEDEVAAADGQVILKVDAEFDGDPANDQEAVKGSASTDSLGTLSPFSVMRKSRSAKDQAAGSQGTIDEDQKVSDGRMGGSSIAQFLNNPSSVAMTRSHSCSEGFLLSRGSRSCCDSAQLS